MYDDLGRLIAVMDQQGNIAIYEYDAVGNILAIRRPDTTAGPVVITLFEPTRGPIGTQVEIFGIGFSDISAENTIAFNGAPAPVLSATLTSLTDRLGVEARHFTRGPGWARFRRCGAVRRQSTGHGMRCFARLSEV